MAETPIDRINPANVSSVRLVMFAMMQEVLVLRASIESDVAAASAALTAAALGMSTAATDLNGVAGAGTVVTDLGTAGTAATDAATAADLAAATVLARIDAELAKLRAVMPR